MHDATSTIWSQWLGELNQSSTDLNLNIVQNSIYVQIICMTEICELTMFTKNSILWLISAVLSYVSNCDLHKIGYLLWRRCILDAYEACWWILLCGRGRQQRLVP